jgi:glycosyltransferase 2 family protein
MRSEPQVRRSSYTPIILRWGIGLAIVGLAIWILARGLDWRATRDSLTSANYRWVAFGVVAILGTFVARGLRWQSLLYGNGVSVLSASTAILVGQVVNTGIPVARSGDFARAVWASQREAVGVTNALGSIVLEKILDLLALCAIALVLLVVLPMPDWFEKSTWVLGVAMLVGLALLYLGLHWQRVLIHWAVVLLQHLPKRIGRMLLPQLEELIKALNVARQPSASLSAALWTVVNWMLGAVANWAVMRAFGVESWPAALFLLAALMLGSAAVPTPGRIGVFEGITVVSLAQFGYDANLALAVGLVLHLVVLAPALVTAAILSILSASPTMTDRFGQTGQE